MEVFKQMRRLIASIVGLTVWATALVAALPVLGPIAALPAMADTPGVSPTCFSQTLNPHPTSPVGQTSDTLFCSPTSNGVNSGSTNTSSGSTGGNGGSHTTIAGTGSGSGQIHTAGGSTDGAGATTAGGVNGTSGTQNAAASNANSKSAPANGGFFGGLTALLAAAGGLGMLIAFLILLAIVLFIVGVVGWLRRREGGAAWGSRFARVVHRA